LVSHENIIHTYIVVFNLNNEIEDTLFRHQL
jgi:hypothetical protein